MQNYIITIQNQKHVAGTFCDPQTALSKIAEVVGIEDYLEWRETESCQYKKSFCLVYQDDELVQIPLKGGSRGLHIYYQLSQYEYSDGYVVEVVISH